MKTTKTKQTAESTAATASKQSSEIVLTLNGEILAWIRSEAASRGLLEKRGGMQIIIHEKLYKQKQAEKLS